MAFSYSTVKTETFTAPREGRRLYLGYNVGSSGMLLNVRLQYEVPGALASPADMKGMETELYLPGDTVSGMGGLTWTTLKTENLGNGVTRVERAYATPGGNVLVHAYTEVSMKVYQTTRIMLVDDKFHVIEGASLSGTDIVKGSNRTGVISMTGAATYTGSASPSWQDLKVAPAGATFQLTVAAKAGDDIEVNLVFSAYNNINGGFDVDTRVLLDATEVCWIRHRFDASINGDANLCMGGRLTNLTAGNKTLKGQVFVNGDFNTITQHFGAARGKLEYRLIRG
jgi:hypothetical protein